MPTLDCYQHSSSVNAQKVNQAVKYTSAFQVHMRTEDAVLWGQRSTLPNITQMQYDNSMQVFNVLRCQLSIPQVIKTEANILQETDTIQYNVWKQCKPNNLTAKKHKISLSDMLQSALK